MGKEGNKAKQSPKPSQKPKVNKTISTDKEKDERKSKIQQINEKPKNQAKQIQPTTQNNQQSPSTKTVNIWKYDEVLPPIPIPGRPLPGQQAADYSLGDVVSSNKAAFVRLAYFSAMLFILPIVVFFVVQSAYDNVLDSHLPAVLSAAFTAIFVQVVYVIFAFVFPEP